MKSYVRMFFIDGGWGRWIDVPIPEGSTFGAFMAQMRFEGHAQSELVYIPLSQIKVAFEVKLSTAPPMMDFTKGQALQ